MTGVTVDGQETETYAYDVNGNREDWTVAGNAHEAAYSADDTLISVNGELSYKFDEDGFLIENQDFVFEYTSKVQTCLILSVSDAIAGRTGARQVQERRY